MIKREELKKGDKVLIVPIHSYTRDTTVYDAQVVGIGPKYISACYLWDDDTIGRKVQFNNDDLMFEKDIPNYQLFLGTNEEYEEAQKLEKQCAELYREISHSISSDIGYEKLSKIKAILDS